MLAGIEGSTHCVRASFEGARSVKSLTVWKRLVRFLLPVMRPLKIDNSGIDSIVSSNGSADAIVKYRHNVKGKKKEEENDGRRPLLLHEVYICIVMDTEVFHVNIIIIRHELRPNSKQDRTQAKQRSEKESVRSGYQERARVTVCSTHPWESDLVRICCLSYQTCLLCLGSEKTASFPMYHGAFC